ncbi:DUF2188 domain-containing protein [Nocardia beijingensis]|uniref:DUF2188 domain-containing protein n=1 Tax=Nocardia beijingensis TaxID=95162 RepID=UPI0018937E63|nr:DUF2188 domain-containing protein [Nocardia beijingensis]MBF6077044.1 DUF2188 domain-containing protein [Nocardia beijingensis]
MSFITKTLAGAVLAAAVLGTAGTGIASADAGAIVTCDTRTKSGGSSRVTGTATAPTREEAVKLATANAKRQLIPGETITHCSAR